MKKLIIRSETQGEDREASVLINNMMMQKECDQIIWYSDMGKRVAEMVEATARMDKVSQSVLSFGNSQAKIANGLADLKFYFADLKRMVEGLEKDIVLLKNPPKKQEPKQPKKKNKENK